MEQSTYCYSSKASYPDRDCINRESISARVMPIVKCLPRKHITWNIISNEIHSQNQIEVTDDDDIFVDGTAAKPTTPRYTVPFSKTILRLIVLSRFSLEFLMNLKPLMRNSNAQLALENLLRMTLSFDSINAIDTDSARLTTTVK